MQATDWDLVHEYGERGECKVFIDRASMTAKNGQIKALYKHHLFPPGIDKRNQKPIQQIFFFSEYDTSRGLVRIHELTFKYVDGTISEPLIEVEPEWKTAVEGNLVELNYLKKLSIDNPKKRWWQFRKEADAYYGIAVPRKISAFIRGKAIENESTNPGLGVTIPYSTPGIKATVYIYDMGVSIIPDGSASVPVRNHFDQMIKDVEMMVSLGIYESARLKRKYKTTTPGCGREFLCAEMEICEGGRIQESYIYLTGYYDKFVKIRITALKEVFAASAAGNFADEFAKTLMRNEIRNRPERTITPKQRIRSGPEGKLYSSDPRWLEAQQQAREDNGEDDDN